MLQVTDPAVDFSLVRGDALFRLQRALGLIPSEGLGVVRRAVLAVVVTWLPVVVAAAVANRLWPGAVGEPLLQHFGVHVRFLLAVPLLIVDDAVAHAVSSQVIPYFIQSGLVKDADRPRFAAIVERAAAWRDGWRPWVAIAGIVVALPLTGTATWDAHELSWSVNDPPLASLRFGVLWLQFVAYPIFAMLLLVWLWRLILATALLWRISRLDLALVPTHPDRAAGLGFVELVPMAFVAPAFAMATVLSARWSHDVLYHGETLGGVVIPLAVFVVFTALFLLVPLLVFAPRLRSARRQALLDYGALVGEHHRAVRTRWILREPRREEAVLAAPELGSASDTVRLYEATWVLSPLPISKRMLLVLAIIIVLPMLPLVAVEVHLGDVLLKIVRTLL